MDNTAVTKPVFTPGPWRVSERVSGSTSFTVHSSNLSRAIQRWAADNPQDAEGTSFVRCATTICNLGVTSNGSGIKYGPEDLIDIDEVTANGRLIAASPALYDACKSVLDVYAYRKQGSVGAVFDGPLPEAQREQLRAALALVDVIT